MLGRTIYSLLLYGARVIADGRLLSVALLASLPPSPSARPRHCGAGPTASNHAGDGRSDVDPARSCRVALCAHTRGTSAMSLWRAPLRKSRVVARLVRGVVLSLNVTRTADWMRRWPPARARPMINPATTSCPTPRADDRAGDPLSCAIEMILEPSCPPSASGCPPITHPGATSWPRGLALAV